MFVGVCMCIYTQNHQARRLPACVSHPGRWAVYPLLWYYTLSFPSCFHTFFSLFNLDHFLITSHFLLSHLPFLVAASCLFCSFVSLPSLFPFPLLILLSAPLVWFSLLCPLVLRPLRNYPLSSYWIGFFMLGALHSPPSLLDNDNKIDKIGISQCLSVYYLAINTSDTLLF